MNSRKVFLLVAILATVIFLAILGFAMKKSIIGGGDEAKSRTQEQPAAEPAKVDLALVGEADLTKMISEKEVNQIELASAIIGAFAGKDEKVAKRLHKAGSSLTGEATYVESLVKATADSKDDAEALVKALQLQTELKERTMALLFAYDQDKKEIFQSLLAVSGLVDPTAALPLTNGATEPQTIFDVIAASENVEKRKAFMGILMEDANAKVAFLIPGAFAKLVSTGEVGSYYAKSVSKTDKCKDAKELVSLLHALISHYEKAEVSIEQKDVLLENIDALVETVKQGDQSLVDSQLLEQVKDKKLQGVLQPLLPASGSYAFELAALASLAGVTVAGHAIFGDSFINVAPVLMETMMSGAPGKKNALLLIGGASCITLLAIVAVYFLMRSPTPGAQAQKDATPVNQHARPNDQSVSVMTFNLHLLRERNVWGNESPAQVLAQPSTTDRLMGEIMSYCKGRGPDYLLLQEVPNPADSRVTKDHADFKKALGKHYKEVRCAPASSLHCLCIAGKQKGSLANFTRHKVTEKRALISAEILIGQKSVTLMSTHISPGDRAALARRLKSEYNPVILGGDFNTDMRAGLSGTDLEAVVAAGSKNYPVTMSTDGSLSPSTAKPVDFLLWSQGARELLSLDGTLEVGSKLISDHVPVVAVFKRSA